MKREFLQLAHVFDPVKHSPAGWLLSEKLDGQRIMWDGGVSRGVYADEVPYANVEKDARYVSRPVATGLWSRYGKVVYAPDWWLDQLPPYPLDGEAYLGRNSWQRLRSTIATLVPTPEWRDVKYMVFDMPPALAILNDGIVQFNGKTKRVFKDCFQWYSGRLGNVIQPKKYDFESAYKYLKANLHGDNIVVHDQVMLPHNRDEALKLMYSELERVTSVGGEGLIIRKSSSFWTPCRVHDMLKVKKLNDMEGTVVGYTAGRETTLGSKLLGKMGALRLQLANGKVFDLSGFTEAEREMTFLSTGESAYEYLTKMPGQGLNWNVVQNPMFPIGSQVTFLFRELSDDGLPKEARYLRH